ncbi:MAG: hypothetical protein KGV57_04160 [Fusobacterium sp.]|nr:hypothetical protein [Fusobacterium sp.]
MKKIYIFIILTLFFISCTKLSIYSAYSSAKHNNYIYAIKKLENSFEINKKI